MFITACFKFDTAKIAAFLILKKFFLLIDAN